MGKAAPPLAERWTELAGLRVRSLLGGARRRRRPVVLVHGLGLAADSLRGVARPLAERHPVHVPDLPGFGESDHPRRALSIVGLSRALQRWCRAAGVSDAVVVGNSYGAQVVAELAAREAAAGDAEPRCAGAVVLIGPTCDPEARSLLAQVVRWARNSRADPTGGNPADLVGPYAKAGFGRVILTARSATRHRIEDRLPLVEVPVLILAGDRDAISPLGWNRELVRLTPRGQLRIIPGGAHSMHGSHAPQLAEAVAEFAVGLAPRPRAGARSRSRRPGAGS